MLVDRMVELYPDVRVIAVMYDPFQNDGRIIFDFEIIVRECARHGIAVHAYYLCRSNQVLTHINEFIAKKRPELLFVLGGKTAKSMYRSFSDVTVHWQVPLFFPDRDSSHANVSTIGSSYFDDGKSLSYQVYLNAS